MLDADDVNDLAESAAGVDGGFSANKLLDRLARLRTNGARITMADRDRIFDAISRGDWHPGKRSAAIAFVHHLAGTYRSRADADGRLAV